MFQSLFSLFVYAQGATTNHDPVYTIQSLIAKIAVLILNPLIYLTFAAALLIFIYGIVEFIAGRENPDARKKGQSHMLWGVIGLFIMFATFTIINIITATFGLPPVTIP